MYEPPLLAISQSLRKKKKAVFHLVVKSYISLAIIGKNGMVSLTIVAFGGEDIFNMQ
jgi:hypothetical protein